LHAHTSRVGGHGWLGLVSRSPLRSALARSALHQVVDKQDVQAALLSPGRTGVWLGVGRSSVKPGCQPRPSPPHAELSPAILPPYPESRSRDSINALALAEVVPVPTVMYCGRTAVGEIGFVWERLVTGRVFEDSSPPADEEPSPEEYSSLMIRD
jgi:hypothetical protein